MKMILVIGGPLILTLVIFSVWSGIIAFGEVDGLEHQAGVEPGGTFVQTDQPSQFAEVEGLDLEFEPEPIEYREGDEITTVRKLNGLNKYTNITLRWPTGIDENWKFVFDDKVGRENCPNCNINPDTRSEVEAGVEMYQIDPPVLVIPAR